MSKRIAFGMIGSGQSPEADIVALNQTISALRTHSRLQDAIQRLLDGAAALYASNTLLGRVVNDLGRFVGGMIALYLYFCPDRETDEPGFTVSRFQAFCVEQNLCSFGRARALLTLMCLSGHLTTSPGVLDRRQRRLRPTPQLIELQRQRSRYQFEALTLLLPRESRLPAAFAMPEFIPVLFRQLGARYAAGFRLLTHAPELSRATESNAGLLLLLHLFLLAADGSATDGAAVPISISALAARLGVARAHVRTLLANAESAGLVRRCAGAGTALIVLPRLDAGVRNFSAALFGLLLHCASAAAEEIACRDQSWFGDATVSSMT